MPSATDAPEPLASTPSPAGRPWHPLARVAFRFFFALAGLFLAFSMLPQLLATLPGLGGVGQFWFDRVIMGLWWPAAQWVKREVLHIPPAPYTDSAPTVPIHVLIGIGGMVVFAAVITVVWSYTDRRRPHYRRLHEWFRVYLRYATGALLVSYGLRKVFLEQFGPQPGPMDLATPVGMLTPFTMLSAFMATSPLYQAFTGWVEVLAGVLLMIRRTSRVGALLAVAAMANVVLLNFAYHFTMYVLSSAMLVMAAILVVPDLPGLARLLVLDRAVAARVRTPLFESARLQRLSLVIGVVLLLALAGNQVAEKSAAARRLGATPLYGAWDVVGFERRGQAGEGIADPAAWRRFTVDRSANPAADAVGAVAFDAETVVFAIRADTVGRLLTLIPRRAPKAVSRWSWSTPDAEHVVLAGVADLHLIANPQGTRARGTATPPASEPRDSIHVTLRRVNLGTLPLLRRQPWFQ
jgi:uncharacterized membrane protein YphA (DoxX/SURF4 family)